MGSILKTKKLTTAGEAIIITISVILLLALTWHFMPKIKTNNEVLKTSDLKDSTITDTVKYTVKELIKPKEKNKVINVNPINVKPVQVKPVIVPKQVKKEESNDVIPNF
jgi:hypothetical protein